MTPSKYKPVIQESWRNRNWKLVREISISELGKEWIITYPPLPVTQSTYEAPVSLPDDELPYLKDLCARMAYYCGNAHFDGYHITLAELYGFLDYYYGPSVLWVTTQSEN